MTPAEAEMLFLENAKKLSMYGVDLHHAKVKSRRGGKYIYFAYYLLASSFKPRINIHAEV